MRALHFLLSGVAVLGLVISLGAQWWVLTLESGLAVAVTGLSFSASASSLLAAAGAAFALGLVLRGWWRRVVTLLYSGLLAGVVTLWALGAGAPESSARSEITALTGLEGNSVLDFVSLATPTGFFWVGMFSAGMGIVAGIVGVVMPEGVAKKSRYERHDAPDSSGDPVVTWDMLSSGEDPTHR